MNNHSEPVPLDPPADTAAPRPGLLGAALRITGARASAASRRIAASLGGAQALAEATSGKVSASVSEAKVDVAKSLPDAGTMKVGFGRALILGGQALMDPKAVVGNFAIELGQRLATGVTAPVWLSLVEAGDGFELLARGDESEVRVAAAGAMAQQRAVLVCKVMEAHSPALLPAPPG
jgi:hypothetical protein